MDWLEYLPNAESPDQSHYRCRLCYHYTKNFPTTYFLGALSSEAGVLKTGPNAIQANKRVINDHRKSRSHAIVVADLQKQKRLKLQVCLPYSISKL